MNAKQVAKEIAMLSNLLSSAMSEYITAAKAGSDAVKLKILKNDIKNIKAAIELLKSDLNDK